MALGKFTLNISNVPINENFDYVKELYSFIELLVPQSYYFPMTLENMNDLSFTPKSVFFIWFSTFTRCNVNFSGKITNVTALQAEYCS